MSETDHTRWKDDVAAYVLGALEPGEAAELERHLAGCADCRAELRWLRPAVDLLPEKRRAGRGRRAELRAQDRRAGARRVRAGRPPSPSGRRPSAAGGGSAAGARSPASAPSR